MKQRQRKTETDIQTETDVGETEMGEQRGGQAGRQTDTPWVRQRWGTKTDRLRQTVGETEVEVGAGGGGGGTKTERQRGTYTE